MKLILPFEKSFTKDGKTPLKKVTKDNRRITYWVKTDKSKKSKLSISSVLEMDHSPIPELNNDIKAGDVIQTPFGMVKIGMGQIEKLKARGRIGQERFIRPTLEDPTIVINDNNGARIFTKHFDGHSGKVFASVVVRKDDINVSISNHFKKYRDVSSKMRTGQVVFIKPEIRTQIPEDDPTFGSTPLGTIVKELGLVVKSSPSLFIKLEKARKGNPKLILRTDLPYTRNGRTFYRSGYVLPEDAKKLDQSKNGPVGGSLAVSYVPDLFDSSYSELVDQEIKKLFLVGASVQAPGVSGKLEAVEPHFQDGELVFMMKIGGKWFPENKVEALPEVDEKRIKAVLQNVTPETRAEAQVELFGGPLDPEVEPPKAKFKPVEMLLNQEWLPRGYVQPSALVFDIKESDIGLVPEKDILNKDRPEWIPEIEDSFFKTGGYRLEFSKLPETDLFAVIVGESKLAIASLSVVAATQDYMLKRARALAKKKIQDRADFRKEAVERLSSLNEELKGKEIPDDVYREKVRGLESVATFRQGMTNADRILRNMSSINILQNVKPERARPIKSLADIKSTFNVLNLHEKIHGKEKKWTIHREMMQLLKQKLADMECLYEDWETSFGKGRETAYGSKGTVKDLVDDVGVYVKRQNGDVVDKEWLDGVRQSMKELYAVFGDRSSMAKSWGLKISCAGDKMQHARKAIGIFFPKYKAIGVSGAAKSKGFGFTLAHEFGHFMDYYVGSKLGKNYATDDYFGPTRPVVHAFRGNMKVLNDSKYWNRTCEVFARAMEQYFAEKTGSPEYNGREWYCKSEVFKEKVMPAIDSWLNENKDLLKSRPRVLTVFDIRK